MKIAVVCSQSPTWPKMEWVRDSLSSLGHAVRMVHTRDELIVADRWADLCIFQHKSHPIRWPNLWDIAATKRSVWVQWWFDLICLDNRPLEQHPFFNKFYDHMSAMDMVFVKERLEVPNYRLNGIRAFYLDQGCPEDIPPVTSDAKRWDVLAWGQAGAEYRERVRAAEKLIHANFRVGWVSQGPVPKGAEPLSWRMPFNLPALASQSRMVLSVGRRNDVDGYVSDGFWMALGMGACVLRKHSPVEFPEDCCILFDSDPVEAATALKQYPEFAESIGRNARQWVMRNHTVKHRCREMLEVVQRETGADISAEPINGTSVPHVVDV